MNKIKIKFAGINSSGYKCYVTEGGNYIANIENEFYILNQAPEYGFEGIDGEVSAKLKKEFLEIVDNF